MAQALEHVAAEAHIAGKFEPPTPQAWYLNWAEWVQDELSKRECLCPRRAPGAKNTKCPILGAC